MLGKINPALADTSKPGCKITDASNRIRVPCKWERVLSALLAGNSYNRFEAERDLHDHCLHTTVSILQRKGVRIDRKYETVRGFLGIPTDVCRYWLPPESREAAVEAMRRRRGRDG
jgi:hypothetical protein